MSEEHTDRSRAATENTLRMFKLSKIFCSERIFAGHENRFYLFVLYLGRLTIFIRIFISHPGHFSSYIVIIFMIYLPFVLHIIL